MHTKRSSRLPQTRPLLDGDALAGDLGPLAWVMEDVRKCLELAGLALRRQVRESGSNPRGSGDLVDAGGLPMARMQLHQTAGALDLVGLAAPARVVRTMESAVQVFIERPGECTKPAAMRVERAGFAVADFLDGLLAGKQLSSVGLFPQYEALLQGLGAERIHPADLWHLESDGTRHLEAVSPSPPAAQTGAGLRTRLDQAVLRVVKTMDTGAARELVDLCEYLAQADVSPDGAGARSLWRLAAGFFEALSLSLLPADLYVKRTASRVLVMYVQLAQGRAAQFERLGHDLAFFCAQAGSADAAAAPRLAAVRDAWGLARHTPLRYDQVQFGRFDPILRSQVRKRLVAVRESWAALTGGDTSRLRSTSEQLLQLHEALVRLHPPLSTLATGLSAVARDLSDRAQPPGAELAMEMATAILFLEAVCQDFDPSDALLVTRMQRVADRLQGVLQGQAPQPLEPWVEELYRRVSHRQTMGSVVDELRSSLAGLEKELDAFSRDPAQRATLHTVPGRLSQMRGVLSVLGLDHAALAVLHMRDAAQALMQAPSVADFPGWAALGHNLSALGFLIDMLDYQPALARKLFRFDEVRGELMPVMGRAIGGSHAPEVASQPVAVPVPVPVPVPGSVPAPTLEIQAKVPERLPPPVSEVVPDSVLDLDSETQVVPEDRLKVVGPLHIDQALFNVYLTEADEWSRQLQAAVAEWALDPRQPLTGEAVAWAHSLCGSSAMIGFTALADLARQMETSWQRTQSPERVTPAHMQAYAEAVDEVRRLLHQFAAGFLPQAQPHVMQALLDLEASDPPVPPQREDDPAPPRDPDPLPDAEAESRPAADAMAGEEPLPDRELFPFFEEEALELLPLLGAALRRWHAQPGSPAVRDEALRTLHTLKGSARLAGALSLGDQAHALESLIEGFAATVTGADLVQVLQEFDAFQSAFDRLRTGHAQAVAAPSAALATPQPTGPQSEPVQAPDALSELATPMSALTPSPAPTLVPASTPEPASAPAPGHLPSPSARVGQGMVRVRAQLLDRLVNQAGEVMITRARLESDTGQLRAALHELTADLARLRAQLRDLELQSELQMQSHQAKDAAASFDPLEFDRYTRVQELARMMAETVGDVASVQHTLQRTVESAEDSLSAQARQTRELQRDLLRTRMLEFDAIADRLHRVVRLASQESGKPVQLDIQGGAIEMDRGILDRMTPAFEHLLRNAVVHGIEAAAARVAAGKPASGQLRVRLDQEGNDVCLRFEDDGGGLDLDLIRDKAVALGLLSAQVPITQADAARLVFTPGFSTAQEVSQLAGRGVGMDVVRAEVQAVGGRIEVHSQPGQGVAFELVLPLTTAVTQVVMLRCGALVFGVPVPLVEGVASVAGSVLSDAQDRGHLDHEGQALPFFWAGALLQVSPRSEDSTGRSVPVVILRSAAQRLALQVDEVQGRQEVVVKHLGPQLARLPGLAGVTVLPSGAVVLIYNPVALAAVHGQQARAPQGMPSDSPPGGQAATLLQAAPLVLVVDDSITVRRVTQRLLQRDGYRVALAGDGLQALEQLALETPALVLSDIEMPRMDGFELVRSLRNDARWRALPVVMITSRIAPKHRDRAREIGVNDYLGKPYPEDELLALVRRYARA